jgi:hypothetical protein
METKYNSSNKRSKKSFNPFSLRSTVIISYLVSLISNSLFIFVVLLAPLSFKLIAYTLHILLILYNIYALKIITNYAAQLLKKYLCINKIYSLLVVVNFLYYCFSVFRLWKNKTRFLLLMIFSICMGIWCLFHILFLFLLKQFVKNLEQRPMQKTTKKVHIDKTLSDLFLKV